MAAESLTQEFNRCGRGIEALRLFTRMDQEIEYQIKMLRYVRPELRRAAKRELETKRAEAYEAFEARRAELFQQEEAAKILP